MSRFLRALILGPLLAAAAQAGFAYQPLITDDTGTQGDGGNQLEFSVNQDRANSPGIDSRTTGLRTTYTRGLTDTLDVAVSVGHARLHSNLPASEAAGAGNPAIGAKWRFYENEASQTSLALKPEIRLPVSADKEAAGLGTGRISYGLGLLLTHETSFGELHANVANSRDKFYDSDTNPHMTTTRFSLAPVWHLDAAWKLALDIGRERQSAAGQRTWGHHGEIGVIYSPHKDLDFAAGILRQTDSAGSHATTDSATLGVTWRFR